MKKILLTLALAAFAFNANAQFVIGGRLGVDHGSNWIADDYSYDRSHTYIRVLPKIGYQLNDKMQIGVALGLNYEYEREYGATGGVPATNYASNSYASTPSTSIIFNPYFRYNFATWEKCTLFCEARASVSLHLESKTHSFINGSEETGYPRDNGDKSTYFGIDITPGLNYAFSGKFSMDLYINLASLGWNMATSDGEAFHGWYAGANLNSQSLDSHLSKFSIGFNYHL